MKAFRMTRLFLALALVSASAWAQDTTTYPAHIAAAESLYDAEDYAASGAQYDAAFALQPGSVQDYYNAACSWSLAGESTRAFTALTHALDAGYSNVKWLSNDSDLNTLHDLPEWAGIVERAQANQDEAEKDYNLPLKAELEQLFIQDQTLRQLYRHAQDLFGADSDEMNYFWGLMAAEDEKALDTLLPLLDEHGWPGTSSVGGRANAAVFLIIQHAPLEIQEQYLPLLQASVQANESRGADLALLQDRILMRKGQPQLYGSQIVPNGTNGRSELYLLLDPLNVNTRRASVGLGPIEEYLKRFDLEWDPDAMQARLQDQPKESP